MRWVWVALVVGSTVASDILQSKEMKRHGAIDDFGAASLGRAAGRLSRRMPLILAVFFMAVSFFSFLQLVSIADLSFAVPATAASIVLETLLAKLILKEQVRMSRWAGAILVACGVALLAQ